MKQCYKCKQHKELTEFGKNKSRKDGLQTSCKPCDSSRSISYYNSHKTTMLAKVKKKKASRKQTSKQYAKDYLLAHPCIDCGNDDLRVLDFDHRKNKHKDVCRMIHDGYGLQTVKREIDKCDIRCANCHRIKHSLINKSGDCDPLKTG